MTTQPRRFLVVTGEKCQYCRLAKQLLEEKGHMFEELDLLDATPEQQRTGTTVPKIWEIDLTGTAVSIGGYSELHTLLEGAA